MDTAVETALRKIVKGTNPGSLKQTAEALQELGCAVVIERKPLLVRLSVPGVLGDSPEGWAEWTFDFAGYKKVDGANLMAFATYGREKSAPKVGYGDPDYKKNSEQNHSMGVLTRSTLVNRARKLLAEPEPRSEDLYGPKPEPEAKDRGACQVCFRSTAIHTASGLLHDHGYRAPGRGTGSVQKSGSCYGSGHVPYAVSCTLTQAIVADLEAKAEGLLDRYVDECDNQRTVWEERRVLTDGRWTPTMVRLNPGDDGYEQARSTRLANLKSHLRNLWSGWYGSLPWYRMAVAAWTPGAVGPQEAWVITDHNHEAHAGRPELT